jgi:hypothetical protein
VVCDFAELLEQAARSAATARMEMGVALRTSFQNSGALLNRG